MDIWDSKSQVPPQGLKITWVTVYAGFILVNVASSVGWLGATNKEISAKHETPLTPAGWAFSIWGVIFLLQFVGSVYMLLPAHYEPDGWKQRFVNSVGSNWVASWLLAIGWQFAFLVQTPGSMWLALLFIVGSLLAMGHGLLQMYRLLHQYGSAPNPLLYIAYFLPTSITTAWLFVASAVQLLIAAQGPAHGADLGLAAALLAAAVTAGGAYLVLTHRDTAYGLTLIWALVAVYEKTPSQMVRNTAVAGLAVTGVCSLLSVLRRRPEAGGGASVGSVSALIGGGAAVGGLGSGVGSSADVEARQPLRPSDSSLREDAP